MLRKKPLILTVFLFCIVLAAGIICLPLLLSGSQGGTRWLLQQVDALLGESLSVTMVEGRLLSELTLHGLHVKAPGIDLLVDSVYLDWQPLQILSGHLQVDDLRAQGVVLQLTGESSDTEPVEPLRPEDIHSPLSISLAQVLVQDLVIVQPDASSYPIHSINISLGIDGQTVDLQRLQVDSAMGSLSAVLHAELLDDLPLEASVDWSAVLPDQHNIGGQLTLSGDLNQLALEHVGTGAIPVAFEGSASKLLTQPSWAIVLSWPDSQLYLAPEQSIRGAGWIESSGTLEQFKLSGDGEVGLPGLAPVHWTLASAGTKTSLTLDHFQLQTSPYALTLEGLLGWEGDPTADLRYQASVDELQSLSLALPQRLEAEGGVTLRYLPEQLIVDAFTLALEQSAVKLKGRADLGLADTDNPALTVELGWTDLGWPLATGGDLASPGGSLTLNGHLREWRLAFNADVAGGQVPPGSWRGEVHGDTESALVDELLGETLGGQIALSGPVTLIPQVSWDLSVAGQRLNPGKWQPGLDGELALALQVSGRIDEQTGVQVALELESLEGYLGEIPLQAGASASLTGDTLELQRLALASGRNQLSASGRVVGSDLALDWRLTAPEPGVLLPGAAGELSATGRLGGNLEQPVLQVAASGSNLVVDTLQLASLDAEIRAGIAPAAPFFADITVVGQEGNSDNPVELAQLTGTGTMDNHTLKLTFVGSGVSLDTRLEGQFSAELAWLGTLADLQVDTGATSGSWKLGAPVALVAAADQLSLDRACLEPVSGTGGQVCAEATWRAAGGSRVDASLVGLQLERFLPDVTGKIDGALQLAVGGNGELTGGGRFGVSPGVIRFDTAQGIQKLEHGGGRLTSTLGSDGLSGELTFMPLEAGAVSASFKLPQMKMLPLPERQPVTAQVTAALPDLSGLQGWVPALDQVRGRFQADLVVSGSLDDPRISGTAGLLGGAADVPAAGLALRDIHLQLAEVPANPDLLRLDGGLVSGKGELRLEGQVDVAAGEFTVAVNGERIDVFDTPDALARLSPDLKANYRDGLLTVRGNVAVDRADITPRLSLRGDVSSDQTAIAAAPGDYIAASPDVVVVGGMPVDDTVEAALPFRLDSEIVLDLGQKVSVNALGLAGRITGLVIFTNPPERPDLVPVARGSFSVEEGTFRSFGQDLEIENGQLLFRGVPATEPEIYLRAVRWIDNDPLVSQAGVRLTGPLAEPELELFSVPQLDMTEIQSYLLTGRPPSSRDSALTIGTYIRPKLYVGYGFNLLEETSEFDTLYTISPRYGAQASVGEADNNIGVTFTYEH